MEQVDRWVVQLRKGVVELMVLRLLALAGELHGYAIVKELHSRGRLIAGESTVYPVLKRLEADGLLTARWTERDTGPPRKYYQLSDAGASFIRDATTEWDTLVESMKRLKGDGRRD
ncbi:MAG: PadR family transcriptional regulator [Actinomycetota bacterium]|nr:PadR family transcriptional regulator [Actinomycetota bacterium]MDZ4179063.1 PadR family transcriptional regulator [Coriobacteriia bacterium]